MMRRLGLLIALSFALSFSAFAQEPGHTPETTAPETGDPLIVWKWVNFLILAGGLAYLIGKQAPAYFRGRTEEVRRAMDEAAREIKDAEAKAANVELRLSGLKTEIENLRSAARSETAAEAQRIREETERHLKRIQEQSGQEIELLTRASRDELRRYSASLALDLAEQRIRSRITPGSEEGLVDGFLHDLRQRAAVGRIPR